MPQAYNQYQSLPRLQNMRIVCGLIAFWDPVGHLMNMNQRYDEGEQGPE
jgi:hypothetical protein